MKNYYRREKIINDFKTFIKDTVPESEVNYYRAAEMSVHLLSIVLRYLDKTNNMTNNNIINSFKINNIINIMFSGTISSQSKKIIKIYVDNVSPNKEHIIVKTLIKNFLLNQVKKTINNRT